MKYIDGNLITLAKDGTFDVIIHGCNCFGVMGSGIAPQIKQAFPLAFDVYIEHLKEFPKKQSLGSFCYADCSRYDHTKPIPNTVNEFEIQKLIVINAFTQFEPGHHFNYVAINDSFRAIKEKFGGQGLRFGIPLIGCGIAGGDWGIVSKIIDGIMHDEDITTVNYKPKR